MFNVCPNCKSYHDERAITCEVCGYAEVPQSVEDIRYAVSLVRGNYELQLYAQQPPAWTPDERTLDIYSLGRWFNETMTTLNVLDDRRRELLWYFNRTVRAEQDPFVAMQATLEVHIKNGVLPDHYKYFSRR